MRKLFVCKIFQELISSVCHRKRNYTRRYQIARFIGRIFGIFSKEETDEEAVNIRQKCEDYVLNINDLQSEILVVKNPTRRVNQTSFNWILRSLF